MFGKGRILLTILAAGSILGACSVDSKLSPGEYRLVKNIIQIDSIHDIKPDDLESYIKQHPASFSFSSRKAVIYNPDLVAPSERSLERHLEYMGWYGSKVSSSIDVKNNKVKVRYRVTPGHRFKVDSISFDLPQLQSFREDFYSDTATLAVFRSDYLSESMLTSQSKALSNYLSDKGYYGMDKEFISYVADTISNPASVGLLVKVNPLVPIQKYNVSKVQITYPESLNINEKLLSKYCTVKSGDQYSVSELNKTYTRLSSLNVFNSVGIEMTAVPDTNLVECNINLTSAGIQGYKVNLEASTNSSGLIGISPQLSYYHKNIFHGGEWLNLSFMGIFQFTPDKSAHSNELGISAGLSLPRFWGVSLDRIKRASIPRTEINTSFTFQDRPEYKRHYTSLTFGYAGNNGKGISYKISPLQVNVVKLLNISDEFLAELERNPFMAYSYKDHFDLGIGGTIYLTDNASVNPKTSYKYLKYSMDFAGNLFKLCGLEKVFGLPYSQYVRADLTLGKTWRFGRNNGQAIATRLTGGAGYAYGNSGAMPFEKQFYAGGANSMRGWLNRTLGPGFSPMQEVFSIPSQTGDLKMEANVEYRFDLFWKFAGALFLDAGNVWTLKEMNADSIYKTTFDPSSIAADWGLGLRCDMNVIVIRIDMGMKIYEPSRLDNPWLQPYQWLRKDGFAIHFGVGYPF